MLVMKTGLIFLNVLVMGVCIGNDRSRNPAGSNKIIVRLWSNCFSAQLRVVITTPSIAEHFFESSSNSTPIPIILLDEMSKRNEIQHYRSYHATFILPSYSMSTYGDLLQVVKSSAWWYVDAVLIIIGNSRERCKPATEILKRAWEINLLVSLFLCDEQTNESMIYTYNPYTNRAPYPWKEVNGYNRPDSRWTLYMQRFSGVVGDCESLNFNRMEFMDGYEIKTVTNPKYGVEWKENTKYNIESLREKHTFIAIAIFWQIVFAVMNVTAIVNYDHPGYFYDGQAVGFLVKLINSTYDISLSGRYKVHNLSTIYPFIQTGPRILTQQQNFLTPEEKILSFYKIEIQYLIGIVLLVTFIFLLIINQKQFSMAALDVLRLLLSSVILVSFKKLSTRIFFFGVCQLIIIINATFPGHLSAFLTKPERHYVNNIKDVRNYNVFAPIAIQDYLDEVQTDISSINYLPSISCIENVVNDSAVACIQSTQAMLGPALKYKLHISHLKLAETYLNFWCRNDWPLRKRIDYYTSRLIEAGLYEYLLDHNVNIPLRKLNNREMDETSIRYRPIELVDLNFAFRLFAICFGFSIMVFFIEMIPRQKLSRVGKRMKSVLGGSIILLSKYRR